MTKFRRNIFLIGLAAIGLGTAPVLALANPGCGPMGAGSGKFAERIEKRQAELHDKLKLTPVQETAWKSFSEKMKPTGARNRPDRSELASLHAPERMEKMLTMMKEHESQMAVRVAAVKEFYAVLTPEQQKLFDDQFSKHRRR
ncbi:Spy/CpxP family protein refolding chaperone [Sulfuricella sp.]|uniref:Spy/CpxP family protein refolding chaperone n=1 Tax=Sulfuricella sp. TaxID=2099377 RepID=UPI002C96BCBB|nr:Spy/CpxP family protein refolding chaperone [Sulfuricella sp.]HUX62546.1 Spy/CpxP family protein refolding chaperone [Sulfuricella sp.]